MQCAVFGSYQLSKKSGKTQKSHKNLIVQNFTFQKDVTKIPRKLCRRLPTKGGFLDLNWVVKLALTDRFAQLAFPVALTNGQNGQTFNWPKSAS